MNAVCEVPNPKSIRKLKRPYHEMIYVPKFDDERRAEKIKIPDMVYEVDEVLRLMRRKPAEKQHDNGCLVCGRGDHFEEDCPCFEKIPPGVELDREYDPVCIGCGKIGERCCSKGAYAVLRRCGACGAGGHWYWDDKCDKDFVPYERVELSFFKDLLAAEQSSLQNKEDDQVMVDLGKDNKKEDDYDKEEDGAKVIFDDESHDERRAEKIKIPDMVYEVDEVLRLMRRKPAEKQHDNGCLVCGRGDHFEEDCPCFEKIPLGVELDREYDQVCIGCGKIGEICCSKGAYAVLRRCGACGAGGHWYWDDKCDKDFVPYERVELSFFKDLLAAEQSSLQNKEEDQVMVDLGKDKDNKNEDDCGTEEYGPKVAGGNQSSYQGRCKFKLLSELEGEVVFRSQVDDSKNLFSLPKHLPSPKELRLLQLSPTTQAGLSWSKDVEAAEYYNQALKQNRQVSRHGLGYQGPR